MLNFEEYEAIQDSKLRKMMQDVLDGAVEERRIPPGVAGDVVKEFRPLFASRQTRQDLSPKKNLSPEEIEEMTDEVINRFLRN